MRKIAKWPGSQGGECPAVYETDSGDLIVQGWQLTTTERGRLEDLATDEDAVRVPRSLIEAYLSAKLATPSTSAAPAKLAPADV